MVQARFVDGCSHSELYIMIKCFPGSRTERHYLVLVVSTRYRCCKWAAAVFPLTVTCTIATTTRASVRAATATPVGTPEPRCHLFPGRRGSVTNPANSRDVADDRLQKNTQRLWYTGCPSSTRAVIVCSRLTNVPTLSQAITPCFESTDPGFRPAMR
jgi:hypothetical protein